MSNFSKMTVHPETKKFEMADWLDDYFGPHRYGVMFSDGTVFDAESIGDLVPQPQVMLPTEVYPIFDILPRLWSAGYKTVEQDGEWHLFRKDGEGIVCGKTFRDLCVNIVLSGI